MPWLYTTDQDTESGKGTITVYDRKHLPTQDSVIMCCFPHVTTFQNDPYR